jgi:hypothetical protein
MALRGFFSSSFSSALRATTGSLLFAASISSGVPTTPEAGGLLNFETSGFRGRCGFVCLSCLLQRISETRQYCFVVGFQFRGCFQICDREFEILFVSVEIGTLHERCEILRLISEHAIQSCLCCDLVSVGLLGNRESDPGGSRRFRDRSRSFGKFECGLRVTRSQFDFRKQS